MPKELFKKYLPDPEKLKGHKNLQFLGERLHTPNLWHLTRRSVAMAFAVGLFFAWVPVPGQMALAALGAFYLRGNLPIAVALVWLTNPITMPPLFYFAYHVGAYVLNLPPPTTEFEFTIESVFSGMGEVLHPFLLGCFLIGCISAVIGYLASHWFWRAHVKNKWRRRQEAREPQNEVNYKTHYDD